MRIFSLFQERVKPFKGRTTYGRGPVGLNHKRIGGVRPGFWNWEKADKIRIKSKGVK